MITDLLYGWAEMEDALPDYEEAEAYFEGRKGEVFTSTRIRALVAATGARYRFNLAKTPVQVMADRVEIRAVTAGSDTVNETIEQLWDANDLDVYYPKLILDTFVYGDAYMMVWPVLDEVAPTPADPTADPQLITSGVEFCVHDPKHVRVFYDPEQGRRKLFALKRWRVRLEAGVEVWRVDLWYADALERWISIPQGNLKEEAGWRMWFEDDEEPNPDTWLIENPWAEVPFVHHRTDIPYGVPEHYAGYGAQDAVTKMLVTQITTTDSHGWPQRYGLTDKGATLDENTGGGPDWEDDQYSHDNREVRGGRSSSQRSGPGTMQLWDGMKTVGQFAAAEPRIFTDPAELYVRLMAQLTTTPLHYFDPSGDAPSGESLRTAEAPLVKKIGNRQVLQRGAVVEEWTLALRMLGVKVDRIDVRWAPVQSAEGVTDWEVVTAKQAAGVPQRQTLVEAGYESEQVDKWLDQEAEAMALATRIPLLDQLADALTKLGAAKGAGVVGDDVIGRIVDTLLPQVAPQPGTEDDAA